MLLATSFARRMTPAHPGLLLAWSRRTLYSLDSLKLEDFRKLRKQVFDQTLDVQRSRAKVLDAVQTPAAAVTLLSDDVRRVVCTANDAQELQEARTVLEAFLQRAPPAANARAASEGEHAAPAAPTFPQTQEKLVYTFFQACRHAGAVEPARDFWQQTYADAAPLIKLRSATDGPLLHDLTLRNYLDLLYTQGHYQSVIDTVVQLFSGDTATGDGSPLSGSLQAMVTAAALKLNTPASFEQASRIVKPESVNGTLFYSLLASRQGNDGLAQEVLSSINNLALKLNVSIYYLSRLQRFEDALGLLTSALREWNEGGKAGSLSTEAIEALTQGVEKSGDDDLKKLLESTYATLKMDKYLVKGDLESHLLGDFEKKANRQKKRKKGKGNKAAQN